VPSGPVNSIQQAFEDEQIEARGLVIKVDHPAYGPIQQVVSPITTAGSNQATTPGPALGQHTDELLSDLLSLDENEIKRLRQNGAVG